jgi:hypothetical protein
VAAAPTLVQIMQAIQVRLAAISGLRTRTDLFIPSQINPPQAVIWMPTIQAYHAAFNSGLMHITCQVLIITSATSDRAGQTALTTFADVTGANSIKVAIEGDKTLGGVVSDCMVVGWRPVPTEDVNALTYYGGTFDLQIYAPGK